MAAKKIIVQGLHISLDISGSGPVVLMLHGWGSDRRTFTMVSHHLAKQYTTIRVDLPGFGESQAPESAWGIEEYSQFVLEVIEKLKIDDVFTLIGHSMGGRISIHLVGGGLLTPQKLILIGSHGINESKSLRNQAYKTTAKVGKVATKVLPKSVQQHLRRTLYGAAGATDYLKAGRLQESFIKIINTDAQRDARTIAVPTLLVYGENDKETPVAYGQRFQELISGSNLRIIEGAGHFVHSEKPEQVALLLEEMMGQ